MLISDLEQALAQKRRISRSEAGAIITRARLDGTLTTGWVHDRYGINGRLRFYLTVPDEEAKQLLATPNK